MAKNSIRDYSATAGSNTDIQSINIDEGCAASNLNNAVRELMADLKNVSTGTIALESPQADSLSVTGNVVIDNATYLQIKDSGGTARDVLAIDAYNGLNINSAGGGSAAPIVFKENGSEIARFHTGGQLIAPNGVTLGTATGTYNSANTLDDYEEGTWTPAIRIGGSTTGITYVTSPSGTYVKVGNLVTFCGQIQLSSKASLTGGVSFGGLPFTVGNSLNMTGTSLEGTINFPYYSNHSTSVYDFGATPRESQNYADFWVKTSANGSKNTTGTDAHIQNTFNVRFSGHYYI